jgi:pimeloyl-ACP methyl ester carboxylesterase
MVGTRKLTESLTITGFASALYDSQSGWPELKQALNQAIRQNNGKPLLVLADQYNQREKDGRYSSNQNDISQIVSCLDFPHTQTIEQMQADESNFAAAAPVFGPYLAYAGISCNYWQAKPVPKPALTNLKTNPLLVIGTTRDPATPYAWAQALHKVLVNSTLITLNGDGHTGANRGSSCVDDAMNKYLLTGISPESDLYCAK